MTGKGLSDRAAASVYRGRVHLADLNVEWFEDSDLAEDLADDCIKLFEASEDDFDEIRDQRWYKKVWSTLTGGNTRKLARGCSSLAHAQQLLLTVLQTHAQTNARSNALMVRVARGLRRMEGQQGRVVRAIVHMADRIELIESELELHRRQLHADPSDEFTWNQEQRTLLLKVMALAAHADGEVVREERDLFDSKLRSLELESDYVMEAEAFLDNPHDVFPEFERVDSYRMRLTLFRHALAVVHSDGILHRQEHVFVQRLATALHVRETDARRAEDAFGAMDGVPSAATLLSMVGTGKKRLARTSAPDAAEYEALDGRRHAMHAEEEARAADVAEALECLEEIAPAWVGHCAALDAQALISRVDSILEAYTELEDPELEQVVAALDAQAVLESVNEHLPRVREYMWSSVASIDRLSPVGALVRDSFDATWQRVLNDDGQWESALGDLQGAGIQLVESEPSGWASVARGGAAGVASALLLGPIGVAGAILYGAATDHQDKKEFERAALRWDSTVRRFAEASERWAQNAERHMAAFYGEFIKGVLEDLRLGGDPAAAWQVAFQVEQDLGPGEQADRPHASAHDHSPEGEHSTCPRCGRGYSQDVVWCEICEVAL